MTDLIYHVQKTRDNASDLLALADGVLNIAEVEYNALGLNPGLTDQALADAGVQLNAADYFAGMAALQAVRAAVNTHKNALYKLASGGHRR